MYSQELENLIEAALADGELTVQEREVLQRRAVTEGVDPAEFNVLIEGRLAQKRRELSQQQATPAEERLGNVAKCPACGALIQGATARCPECGHEFRNVSANRSAKRFLQMLQDAEREQGVIGAVGAAVFGRSKSITAIENFPVPNTTEDLYEMLVTLKEQATYKNDTNNKRGAAMYRLYAKCCEKVIALGLAGDNRFAPFIDDYKKRRKKLNLPLIVSAAGLFLFMAIGFCAVKCGIDKVDKTDAVATQRIEQQLDSLSQLISSLPVPNLNNYAECSNQVMDLVWTPVECVGNDVKEKQDNAIKAFVQRKNAYITQLNNLGVGTRLPTDSFENYGNSAQSEQVDDWDKKHIEEKIMDQSKELSRKISKLKKPKEENYSDCVNAVTSLSWTPVDCQSVAELEALQRREVEAFVQKKNAYIGLINNLGISDSIAPDSADRYLP